MEIYHPTCPYVHNPRHKMIKVEPFLWSMLAAEFPENIHHCRRLLSSEELSHEVYSQ